MPEAAVSWRDWCRATEKPAEELFTLGLQGRVTRNLLGFSPEVLGPRSLGWEVPIPLRRLGSSLTWEKARTNSKSQTLAMEMLSGT